MFANRKLRRIGAGLVLALLVSAGGVVGYEYQIYREHLAEHIAQCAEANPLKGIPGCREYYARMLEADGSLCLSDKSLRNTAWYIRYIGRWLEPTPPY